MLDTVVKALSRATEGAKALFGGLFRGGVSIKRLSATSTYRHPRGAGATCHEVEHLDP